MTPDRIGRYEIQRRLGTGGMGSLYLARDPRLDRLVAIKLLREDCRDDPELRERFVREARSVARLRHPNIVIVHDVGEDDGRPFMAMEYIAGDTLTQILRRKPSLPITERLGLFEALCAGLAHAHAAGIIHRDIKPANMMLDGDGVLKILDFGIARLGNSGITQDGMMMGTINYMSPEQVVGRGVDHRTDIFAAGAVLYEIVALEQAFPGGVDAGVLHRILNEGPVPLDQLIPGVDGELARIVRQALDRDPTRRYQDVSGMRHDVARVRRRLTEGAAGGIGSGIATTIVDPFKSRPSRAGKKADSDRPARLSPERLAQLRRQQVEEHLRYGEEAFARGDHDAALHHAERAATVDADSRSAIDLIDKARAAIEAKAVRHLLQEADRLLAEGNLEDAAAIADEASMMLSDTEGAGELRREVREAAENIAAARDREQRITESLQRARAAIERGGYETALRAVYEVLALEPERSEARQLEQTAKERLQAQREHEQARRTAYDLLKHAATRADRGMFDEAIASIETIAPPSDTVRAAAADALAAVRTLQHQAAHAAIVGEARHALQEGRIEQALAAIDAIPAAERSEAARAVRAAADDALQQRRERERKEQAFDAAIAVVHQLIAAGDLAKAFERLEEAARLGVDDERLPALRQHIADLGVAAQQKRQQEARDRIAAKRIEAAQQLLTNGNGYAAIALLERTGSDHPRIAEALREIHAAVAEQEERVRQEAEGKRREEEARRRAEIEEARKLEERLKAEEQRAREERERRIREAELQGRRDAVTALIGKAERALQVDRSDEATQSLDAAASEIEALQDATLRRRLASVRAEVTRYQKRQQEIASHVSRAQAQLSAGSLEDAREAARAALAMEAQNSAALKVLADIDQEAKRREEERRLQEEARRLEEAARQREEERRLAEEARKREASVAELIGRANELPEHDAAMTLLRQAETIAPGDTRVRTLINQRSAALDAQRAAEKAAQEAARRERERLAEQERDAAAAAVVEKARRIFEGGNHGDAVALLQGSPSHTAVSSAIAEFDARRIAIEQERAREARRRRWQERWIATTAAAKKSVHDRRVQATVAVILVVALAWGTWRVWSDGDSGAEIADSTTTVPPIGGAGPGGAAGSGGPDDATGVRAGGGGPAVPTGGPAVSGGNGGNGGPGRGGTSAGANPPGGTGGVRGGRNGSTGGSTPAASGGPGMTSGSGANPGGIGASSPDSGSGGGVNPSGAGGGSTPGSGGPRGLGVPGGGINAGGSTDAGGGNVSPPGGAGTGAGGAGVGGGVGVSGGSGTATAPGPPIPPPPPPPPVVNRAADMAAIRQLLDQWVTAYTQMDERRLRTIDPGFRGIPSRSLLRKIELTLSEVSINVTPDGETAFVEATQNFKYEADRARFPPTSSGRLVWNLEKKGTTWVVVP